MDYDLRPEVNETTVEQWLTALEKETFKQTKGNLVGADTQSYCVLGVLCKVTGLKVEERKHTMGFVENDKFYPGMPPEALLNEVGLSHVAKRGYLRARDFSEMNDDGLAFPRIAASLRKAYRKTGLYDS